MRAPIVLFVYNRLKHTKITIEYLMKNVGAAESDLFIYSDGPADEESRMAVEEVRQYINTVTGFRTIILRCRESNYGLAASVLEGVTEVVNQYGKVIVLEDDIITSRYFLDYMNEALNRYEKSDKVYSVTGYMRTSGPIEKLPETYFLTSSCSWGWGTWERAWSKFDGQATGWKILQTDAQQRYRFNCDGTMNAYDMLEKQMTLQSYNSWAVKWHWAICKAGALTLYPNKKMCENIGNDCTGVHTGYDGRRHTLDPEARIEDFPVLTIEQEDFRTIVYDTMKKDGKIEMCRRILAYILHPAAVMRKVKRKVKLRW